MFNLDVFEKILKLHVGIAQDDNEKMFELLSSILPLRLSRYKSGSEHNGWVIASKWAVNRATISKNGKTLFDGTSHPLAIGQHSPSFSGTLAKDELHKHVCYREECPDAFNFHCPNNYRPWAPTWAFCIPYNVWQTFGAGEFAVDLQTEATPGEMIVGEYLHEGQSAQTVVFNAHTCHPQQFNDGFSGVAVILELFKWLSKRKTKYSYKAVFGPEHIGTVFYIAGLPAKELKKIRSGIFIDTAGLKTGLALQQSFTGKELIDRVLEIVLRRIEPELLVGPFRSIIGNDETVWEAPGIEIPFPSVSRISQGWSAFPQYHTNEDNLKNNSVESLSQTLQAMQAVVETLEKDAIIERQFEGLVALSNPKYDLYIQRWEPGLRKEISEMDEKLGPLQDVIVRYFDGKLSTLQLAEKFNLPFDVLFEYVSRFEKKGLVKLKPAVHFGV